MVRHCALSILLFALLGSVAPASPTIVVSELWSRPASRTAVVYAVIRNRGSADDRLVGASSPVASRVDLHQSIETMTNGGSMNGMPMNGPMTSMRNVVAIRIPAHGRTVLAPGGYHLMLELRRGVTAGQVIPLRLHFARAGWIAAAAVVKPNG